MKRFFGSFLTIILLFNFIFCNPSYATNPTTDPTSIVDSKTVNFGIKDLEDSQKNGTVPIDTDKGKIDMNAYDWGEGALGAIVSVLLSVINIFPLLIQIGITDFLKVPGTLKSNTSKTDYYFFNILDIVQGKYAFLNANVFLDLKDNLEGDSLTDKWENNIVVNFRANVALWFTIIRDIAIVLNLLSLVYISIRMAIASFAAQKAKYKELLFNWIVSMVILFMLPYIMISINTVADILTRIAKNLVDMQDVESFEYTIMQGLVKSMINFAGFKQAFYAILYWLLLWNQVKFFTRYTKRMFTSFFLVIVSPIITITYAIDKIADRQAQAYQNWLREYCLNMFIQPIHLFTYMVFMFMANEIAVTAPLVGILFLTSLANAEKIVVSMLGLNGSTHKNVGDEFTSGAITGAIKRFMPKGLPKAGK